MQPKTTPVCKGAMIALLCSTLPSITAARSSKADDVLESLAQEIRGRHKAEIADARHVVAGLIILRDEGNRNVDLPAWFSLQNLCTVPDNLMAYYSALNDVRSDRARKQISALEVDAMFASSTRAANVNEWQQETAEPVQLALF